MVPEMWLEIFNGFAKVSMLEQRQEQDICKEIWTISTCCSQSSSEIAGLLAHLCGFCNQ
jgi:hypothetical protein